MKTFKLQGKEYPFYHTGRNSNIPCVWMSIAEVRDLIFNNLWVVKNDYALQQITKRINEMKEYKMSKYFFRVEWFNADN